MAAMGGVHGIDPWLETLAGKLAEEPVPASIDEAIATLAQVGIDVAAVRAACDRLLAAPQADWAPTDWRRAHPEFPTHYALAMFIYSLQNPNVYRPLGTALHSADRDAGPGGVSVAVRAWLPFVKLLDVALVEAAIVIGFFTGQVFRGVKHAFPEPTVALHDPEAHFPPARELHWCEFNSSSTRFNVMYRPWFCGKSGPRTVFTIQSCEGVSIKPFSRFPSEDEVLFRPLARFCVTGSTKKLKVADLLEQRNCVCGLDDCPGVPPCPPHGGFPDDVALTQLETFDAMAELTTRAARLREVEVEHDALQLEHDALQQRCDALQQRFDAAEAHSEALTQQLHIARARPPAHVPDAHWHQRAQDLAVQRIEGGGGHLMITRGGNASGDV